MTAPTPIPPVPTPTPAGVGTGVLGPAAPVCSVPGCGGAVVIGWQRVGSPAEAQAHADFLNKGQAALAAHRTNTLELQIAELQSMQARLQAEGRLTPGAAAALNDSIAAKQQALASPPPPVVFSDPSVTVLVRGCVTHAPDPEFAAVTHEVDCSVAGPCKCARPATCPPVPPGWGGWTPPGQGGTPGTHP